MSTSSSQSSPVISAVNLTKTYCRGREEVRALDGVSFEIHKGEFVAVTGQSGAGKSTLLNLVGCMDQPTSGELMFRGRPVQNLSEQERTRLRRSEIGFVFQNFGLLPTLTVAENVALPALFAGQSDPVRVEELLVQLGLTHRQNHQPHELSGGEMQRVAIARALMNNPALLLADEPTGNLDTRTGESIIALFEQLNRGGLTVLAVTHNAALASAAQRKIELADGKIRCCPQASGWNEDYDPSRHGQKQNLIKTQAP